MVFTGTAVIFVINLSNFDILGELLTPSTEKSKVDVLGRKVHSFSFSYWSNSCKSPLCWSRERLSLCKRSWILSPDLWWFSASTDFLREWIILGENLLSPIWSSSNTLFNAAGWAINDWQLFGELSNRYGIGFTIGWNVQPLSSLYAFRSSKNRSLCILSPFFVSSLKNLSRDDSMGWDFLLFCGNRVACWYGIGSI